MERSNVDGDLFYLESCHLQSDTIGGNFVIATDSTITVLDVTGSDSVVGEKVFDLTNGNLINDVLYTSDNHVGSSFCLASSTPVTTNTTNVLNNRIAGDLFRVTGQSFNNLVLNVKGSVINKTMMYGNKRY